MRAKGNGAAKKEKVRLLTPECFRCDIQINILGILPRCQCMKLKLADGPDAIRQLVSKSVGSHISTHRASDFWKVLTWDLKVIAVLCCAGKK